MIGGPHWGAPCWRVRGRRAAAAEMRALVEDARRQVAGKRAVAAFEAATAR